MQVEMARMLCGYAAKYRVVLLSSILACVRVRLSIKSELNALKTTVSIPEWFSGKWTSPEFSHQFWRWNSRFDRVQFRFGAHFPLKTIYDCAEQEMKEISNSVIFSVEETWKRKLVVIRVFHWVIKKGSTGIRTQVARIRTLSDNQLHYGTINLQSQQKMKYTEGGTNVSPLRSRKKRTKDTGQVSHIVDR
jgi:hypothetical protein